MIKFLNNNHQNNVIHITVYILINFWEEVSDCRSFKKLTRKSRKKENSDLF